MLKVLRSPIATTILFIVAAALLLGGGIGAAQSAPRIQSADYRAEVVLTNIETALVENNAIVEGGDALLLNTFASDSDNQKLGLGWDATNKATTGFKIGATYKEELAVKNVGTIDQFVRVTVYKFWEDKSGQQIKDTELNPDLIELNFVEGNGWTIDKNSSTKERTVLYYNNPKSADGSLAPGDTTSLFADKLTINGKVVTLVTKASNGEATFDYEGVKFRIKAQVDAVQTHNSKDAMTSAWGRTK